MGEYIDKLTAVSQATDEVVELSALEKVKEYFRTINGKKVRVKGHTRKGDGPNHRADMNYAQRSQAAFDKGPTALDKVKDALLGSETTAIDKKVRQDVKNEKQARRRGEKPPMIEGARPSSRKSTDHALFGSDAAKKHFAVDSNYDDWEDKFVSGPHKGKTAAQAFADIQKKPAPSKASPGTGKPAFQAAEAARAKTEVPPLGSLSNAEDDEFQKLRKRLGSLTPAEEARYKALKAKASK